MGKELQQTFFLIRYTVAKKNMKSSSQIIREMQITTTIRCSLTIIRMVIIRNIRANNCCEGCREKGTPVLCWQERKLVQSIWKTECWLFKKLKVQLPYDPTIPLLGIYLKERKPLSRRHICTLCSLSVIHKSQGMRTA